MEIVFETENIDVSIINRLFLKQYENIKKTNEFPEHLKITIKPIVNFIDEIFYSYLYLFNLEYKKCKIEFAYQNDNQRNFVIAKNYFLQFESLVTINSPLKTRKEKIEEYKSISPLILINKETIKSLFLENNFLIETNNFYTQNKSILKDFFNDKKEFFNESKRLKKNSTLWQYYLAILDDLSILRIFFNGVGSKVEFQVDNYSELDREKIVKDVYKALEVNGFFEFNEIQIYLFRAFIDKIKPTKNQLKDSTFKKLKKYIEILVNLISFVKSLNGGIFELANNIVEHSGKKNYEGFGVISIRVFTKKDLNNFKSNYGKTFKKWLDINQQGEYFLDLNIIDSGELDLKSSYIKNIEEKSESLIFDDDIRKLTNEKLTILFDYENIQMIHQQRRQMARLGLLIFSESILSKNGFIKLTTNELNGVCESINVYYNSKIQDEENTVNLIPIGTSYNFILPLYTLKNENTDFKKDIEKRETTFLNEINSNLLLKHQFKFKDDEVIENVREKIILEKVNFPNIRDISDKYDKIKLLVKQLNYIDDTNKIKIVYSDDIFFRNCLSTSSDWFRFLAQYNFDEHEGKPLIIIGDEVFYKNIYLDLIKINSFFEKSKVFKQFWNDSNSLLFYIKRDYVENDKKLSLWFNSVFSGKSYKDFYNLNKEISRYQIFNLVVFQNQKVEKELININNNLFFKNNKLLNFELILKENSNKNTLFLDNVSSLLNLEITDWGKEVKSLEDKFFKQFAGYKIANSHFKLGSKIHIKDFYYAKPMFFNSYYTNSFAFLFASNIINDHLKKVGKEEIVTLIGYENYSELLVSQIRRTINDFEKNDRIKHDTYLFKNDKPIVSKTVKNINGNIILIVPISSTFSTQKKIREDLNSMHKKNFYVTNSNLNFLEPDLTALAVMPEKFDEIVNLSDSNDLTEDPSKKTIRQIFNIDKSDEENSYLASSYKQKYFIKLNSFWYLVYKCDLCIPNKNKGGIDYKDEKCLIFTESNNVTPDLIFDLPISKSTEKKSDNIYNLLFNRDYKLKESDNSLDVELVESKFINVISTPLKRRSFNYQFYIKSSSLLHRSENNKSQIVEWLKQIKENSFKKNKKYVILKQSMISNSGFVDLVNEFVFDNKAIILQFSPKDDNIQNFIKFHKDSLEESTLLYVDDILAYGKSFSLINNYIMNVNLNLRLEYFVTLCNKLNYYDEENLISLLPKSQNLIYFSKINLPTLINYSDDEFFIKRNNLYVNLKNDSHLDLSKIYFKEKLEKNKPKDLELSSEEPKSKPKDLLKALLFHEIYNIFEFNSGKYRQETIINSILKGDSQAIILIIEKIISSNNIKEFIQDFPFYSNIDIKLNILKILSEPPFRGHKHIKEVVFKEVLRRLVEFNFNDDKVNFFKSDNNFLFNEYQMFKLLLRIAVNLNINYLYSVQFLIKINDLIRKLENNKEVRKKVEFKVEKIKDLKTSWSIIDDNSQKITFDKINKSNQNENHKKPYNVFGFRTYFSCLIQELIFEDDAKAAVLIKNIWKIVNEIELTTSSKIKLKNIKDKKPSNDFHSNYIDLLRILILENNFVFERFYNNFIKSDSKDEIFSFDKCEINRESQLDKIKLYFEKYRSEALELMLYDYNKNKIDKELKELFFKTIALKTTLYVDYTNKIQREKGLKEKLELILQKLCEILGIGNGGAYLTLQFKNKNVDFDKISSDDLYSIAQVQSNEDYLIEEVLEDDNSIVLDLFKGIADYEAKKPKSTFELYCNKSNIWDHKAVQYSNFDEESEINYNQRKPIECEFGFKSNEVQHKNLFFLRLSKIEKKSDDKFVSKAIAVITFYSSDLGKHFNPKNIRFLLLLRAELTKFIEYQLDNDSLAGLIAEEERNKFQLKLNHGISIYEESFKSNLNELIKCKNKENINNLLLLNKYYTNKSNLITLFKNKNIELTEYCIKDLLLELENNKSIFNFRHPKLSNIRNIENQLLFKNLTSSSIYEEMILINMVFYNDLIFELFFNIRKHSDIDFVDENNKLIVLFKISKFNNHYEIKLFNNKSKRRNKYSEKSIKIIKRIDGINLINVILKELNNRNEILIKRIGKKFLITLKIYR